jgi:hypothetical protein
VAYKIATYVPNSIRTCVSSSDGPRTGDLATSVAMEEFCCSLIRTASSDASVHNIDLNMSRSSATPVAIKRIIFGTIIVTDLTYGMQSAVISF